MAMLASVGASADVLFIHAAMVRTRIRAVIRHHCAVLKSSEPSSLRDLSTKRYSKTSPVLKQEKLIKYTTKPHSRYSSVGLSVGVMPNDVNYKIKNL